MNPIALLLRALLDELDRLEQQHVEFSDTLAREELAEAVHRGFIVQEPGFDLPSDFGLFTQQGNDAVRTALAKYLQTVWALRIALRRSNDRVRVVWSHASIKDGVLGGEVIARRMQPSVEVRRLNRANAAVVPNS